MKKYFILSLLISQTLYNAPRVETEQSTPPDENFSAITIEDELITRKLEVTESAIICKDVYLCNLTVGDTFSISGDSQLTNLTVTGDTVLNEGSVIGNFTIGDTLSVTNNADIGCNLTVGCNIYTQDSNFSIGNYYKGGVLWLHNFGINNTFLGKNAGNLALTGAQNIGIGDNSLTVLAAGNSNTAFGYFSAGNLNNGSNNTYIGRAAGFFTNSGSNNTGLGEQAGRSISTGSSNTALGHGALASPFNGNNITGSNNTAVGDNALNFLGSTGSGNTAIGQGSMISATTALNNSTLGQATLPNISTGNSNIAIGVGAGTTLTTGSGNIYINANAATNNEANTIRIGTSQTRNFQLGIRGVTPANTDTELVSIDSANQLGTGIIYNDANFANTTSTQGALLKNNILWLHNAGPNNVFLGRNAGNRSVTGSENIAIGTVAGQKITSGSNNIGIGPQSLNNLSSGFGNIAIGQFALGNLAGGGSNIAIGSNAGSGITTTGTNNIYINNVGTNESNVIRLGNDSHVAFICEAIQNFGYPAVAPLDVVTGSTGADPIGVNASSKRFKENIQTISSETANLLLKANPVTFTYIAHQDLESKPLHYGFIAEEIEEILPDLVAYKDGQPFSVVYRFFYALLLKLIQDHDKKINALEASENLEKGGKTDTKTIKLIKTELADHTLKLNNQESIISQLKSKIENQETLIQSLSSDIALLKAIIESISKTTKIAK